MWLLLALVVTAYLAKRYLSNLKYGDFDGPSPWLSFPLIGHGYLLGDRPPQKLREFQKKYGDIFRLDIGDAPTIMICKYGLVKEAFAKEAFSGRFWNEIPTLNAVAPVGQDGK